jgi:DNA-binding MarR family transcriptional regulator
MRKDTVDHTLGQWRRERPDLAFSGLAVALRIDILAKLLRRGTERTLAAHQIKIWEYDVLSALRRQGEPYALPATELANAALLTTGAMTTRIDHLEERRLVQREPDPDDRRGVRISLTKRGVTVIDRAVESRLAAAESAVSCLSPGERSAIERSLRKLLLSLGPSSGK